MILTIVVLLLSLVYVLLMLLYMAGWYLQKRQPAAKDDRAATMVSIIIPARNEAENIVPLLQSVLNNRYPAALVEIIVVDDNSTDETAALAMGILKNSNGRVLALKDYLPAHERINSYKKKALEIAVSESKGQLIITTDADCIVPENWISSIVSVYERQDAKFIAAPVVFSQSPIHPVAPVLMLFQSLDFITMQGITAASARLDLGNMCNGANLAFDKKAFEAVNGYQGIDHIASGDDMLLMYKIRQQYPNGIRYLKSKAAVVQTAAQESWKAFFNQRIRWSSKAGQYQERKMTGILAMIYFFNLCFPILVIAGFFNGFFWKLAGIIFLIKIITELLLLIPVAFFFGKQRELWAFPLLQPLHILYIISAGFLGKFGSYQWKDRRVK